MATEESHQSLLEPWHSLDAKVVMVTGASSGLGRDFCLDLARAGCQIVAVARRLDRLKSLCDEINQMTYSGGSGTVRAVALELDVCSDGSTINSTVQKAWDAFGCFDKQCWSNVKTPLEMSEKEWDHVFRTNLTGSWLVSKYVCKRMVNARQKGSIINISSISGLCRGIFHGAVAYSSSKAALIMLTKIMAIELGAHKIRVNCISPGLFKSEITEKLIQKGWVNNVAMKVVPMRRIGTSDPSLTSLARCLIHDSSEYVSGNNYIVDGGTTLPGLPIYSSL